MGDKKLSIAWGEPDNKRQVTLRQLLRPSLITMAICGCYTYDPGTIRSGQATAEDRMYRVFGTIYRTFCLVLCLVACGKALAAFANVPSDLILLNVVKTIWYSQCLIIFLISLKSSFSKHGSQKTAFDFWDDKIWSEMEELGITFPVELIQKRQRIHICVAIVLATINIVYQTVMFTDVISGRFKVFAAAPFAPSLPVLILEGIFTIEITMIWFVEVSYMMTVSTVIASSFEVFNGFLESNILPDCTKMTMLCHKLRLLHLNIAKVVSQFDQDFGCYFAAKFVFSIGLSCFLLYQLLKNPTDTASMIVFAFWVAMALIILALASISAAIVNDAVSIDLDLLTTEY